jgi:hypothetical protein
VFGTRCLEVVRKGKVMIRALLALGLVLAVGVLARGAGQGAAGTNVRIVYDLPAQVSQNAPLVPNVQVRNDSSEAILIDLGKNDIRNSRVFVQHPNGRETQLTFDDPRQADEVGTLGAHTIGPRDTYNTEIVLNDAADFAAVGRHLVRVEFAGSVETLARRPVSLQRAFSTEIMVQERNEKVLRDISERLVKDIESTEDVSTLLWAANRL